MNKKQTLALLHKEVSDSINLLHNEYDNIINISDILYQTIMNNGIIYFCGNGGSAADSQHIAAEFVGKFLKDRKPLPAISLTTNTSILTAIGNDYSFDNIFDRQVEALVRPNDCLIGISTSGNSKNIHQAILKAKQIGAKTIGFTGSLDTALKQICDITFVAPSKQTPHIQEIHIIVWHMICTIIEQEILQ